MRGGRGVGPGQQPVQLHETLGHLEHLHKVGFIAHRHGEMFSLGGPSHYQPVGIITLFRDGLNLGNVSYLVFQRRSRIMSLEPNCQKNGSDVCSTNH